jgi:hypothetical protein
MYSWASDLSDPEIQILELIKKNDGPLDVLNEIYKQLDPLESALVFLARNTNRDLRRDPNGAKYEFTQGSEMIEHEMGTSEFYDTLAEIKRLENDKITVTTCKGSKKEIKTYNLDEFINKTREIALEKLNHQKIHQSVLRINPELHTYIYFNKSLSDFDYLEQISDFRSHLNPYNGMGKTTAYSSETILTISGNKFRLKHINHELDHVEFSSEAERMKKISEFTKTAEDLLKNSFSICTIKREPNPSNPLLPIVLITTDKDSYVINNDSVTIKISGKEEVIKSLEEFVTNFQEIAPSNYPGTPRGIRVNVKNSEEKKVNLR